MNSASKAKSKKLDKSPKAKTPSGESGPELQSSGGVEVSHTAGRSTSKNSPSPAKQGQFSVSSLGGATGVTTSAAPVMTTDTQATLLSPSAIKPTPTVWFTAEIQQMMYGFGDCRKPLAESASLIEEIVHQQMVQLLYQAEDVGRLRNTRFLSIEDLLFLLRKDKAKLRRLLRYMTLRDLKTATFKTAGVDDEEVCEPEIKTPAKKRRKICYDFLSAIDQTGELTALFDDEDMDEVKHERALRAELLTRNMDTQQYIEYCEARRASFTPRYKIQKFKDWLMAGVSLDIKPNPLAMEVLSYLAHETVAQVVDLALLVKKDQSVRADDPFSQTLPALCVNHDMPAVSASPDGICGASSPGMKSPSSRITSPAGSPPATPTNTGGSSTGVNQSAANQGSSSGSASKSKNKKKKKSGSSSSRDVFTSQAITPAHIREAMRRYGHCVGPFADFVKCPLINPIHKLLCC